MDHKQQIGIIQKAEQYVRETLFHDNTGHDWWHAKRVYNLSLCIAEEEIKCGAKVNLPVIKIASLLHDIADWKFQNGDESIGPQKAREWLRSECVADDTVSHVCQIIQEISFKGIGVSDVMSTIEGAIIQDADRLDALGAVGIARCFATGTKLGNTMHDPETKPAIHKTAEEYKKRRTTSINHFYEKLFLLKDRMKTKTGKRLAETRHGYMEEFVRRFLCEWDGGV